jgi:hypothetical protein
MLTLPFAVTIFLPVEPVQTVQRAMEPLGVEASGGSETGSPFRVHEQEPGPPQDP